MVRPSRSAELVGAIDLERDAVSGVLPVNRGAMSIDPNRNFLRSLVPAAVANFLLVSDTAYWVYLGRLLRDTEVHWVQFYVGVAGGGVQTAEVGFFSGSDDTYANNITVTKLVATGTVTSLTSTGGKANTTDFATVVAGGTHLWAGVRTAMSVTQPSIHGLLHDSNQGRIRSTATAGTLTGTGPWTAAKTNASGTGVAALSPDLWGELIP